MPKLLHTRLDAAAFAPASTAKGITRTRNVRSELTTSGADEDFTRRLVDAHNRILKPLNTLSALPFAAGLLVTDLALPGIRGRVAAVSGHLLTLRDETTAGNFAVYTDSDARPNASVFAADPSTNVLRSGSVRITEIRRDLVAIGGDRSVAQSKLVSGSGSWSTAIPGLSVGDLLYGASDHGSISRVYDENGAWTGDYTPGPCVRLRMKFGQGNPSGAFVLSSRIQPALIWWLPSLAYKLQSRSPALPNPRWIEDRNEPGTVWLGSQYACTADLWIF